MSESCIKFYVDIAMVLDSTVFCSNVANDWIDTKFSSYKRMITGFFFLLFYTTSKKRLRPKNEQSWRAAICEQRAWGKATEICPTFIWFSTRARKREK